MKPPPIETQRILRLAAEIEEDLDNLRQVGDDAQVATARVGEKTPDRFELRAIGSILHDFYSGVESLLERVALVLNGGLPERDNWHSQLLRDMALDLERVRPPVISTALRDRLDEYRRFGHVFRHVYGHTLKWERMSPLLVDLPDVLSSIREEVKKFLQFLHELANQLEDA